MLEDGQAVTEAKDKSPNENQVVDFEAKSQSY